MKKAKKNHNYHNIPYTPGRNMFGEKAEAHLIVLTRETALQQMLDSVMQLDGTTKEFTFDMRCFVGHEDEANEVLAKVSAVMALRAKYTKEPFAEGVFRKAS